MDGYGKEIQFSFDEQTVDAEIKFSHVTYPYYSYTNAEDMSQLNFDVNVRGGWPNYSDKWKILVEG